MLAVTNTLVNHFYSAGNEKGPLEKRSLILPGPHAVGARLLILFSGCKCLGRDRTAGENISGVMEPVKELSAVR
jgi:hypothetical protein